MTDHTKCEARIRGLMKQIVLGDMAWKVLIKRAREQRDTAEARVKMLEAELEALRQ